MNAYIPSEFTIKEYERLLDLAQNKFKFSNFINFKTNDDFILWRHDVDFSLEQAEILAIIENKKKVSSTYFLHLHSEFYNLLDLNALKIIKNILSLGHSIGLHFDVHYYSIESQDEMVRYLAFEKDILEKLFHSNIDVFSFHNTNNITEQFRDPTYAGMINTYSDYFKHNVAYCSDSNGYWRFRKLGDMLKDIEINRLQVLTHAEWWTESAMMPREKVIQCIHDKTELTIQFYDKTLLDNGRVNLK